MDRESLMEEIRIAYNEALADPKLQIRFKSYYNPIILDLGNEAELAADPIRNSPEFKKSSSGRYYAIPIGEKKRYAILPRFGLKFDKTVFYSDAMNLVFKRTPLVEDGERYQVTYPALFVDKGDYFRISKLNYGCLLIESGVPV